MMYVPRTDSPHRDRRDWHNIRNLAPLLWDYRGRVLLALTCLVAARVANVGVPLLLAAVVDSLDVATVDEVAVVPVILLVGYGLLRLASSLFNELRDVIFARVRYHAMRALSVRVLRHLHGLSLRYHLERKTGAVARDLERGTRSLSSLLNYMVFNVLPTGAELLLVAVILLSGYDVWFSLLTLAAVLVYVVFTVAVSGWRMHYRHRMNALDSEAGTQSVDSLINYETVKYFGNEELEARRFDSTLALWEEHAVHSQSSMSLLNFGQGAIIAVAAAGIMLLAARGVAAGTMTLGDLVLVNALFLQLFVPLNILGIVYRQIHYALADMDLMVRLLEREPEVRDRPDAHALTVSQGRLRFRDVGFAYDPQRTVLDGVDFTVEPGQKVAVVGPSGAGKSTLARLLFRFYDVTSGVIEIDGHDVRDVSQASLRATIGMVPQDTVLFNDTILYNLRYADPQASREQVVRAARLAHIHEFIESLPSAYDTVVGERGLKLSGGEKQRVAIARAILKDPPILVFDEATSSLDSRTERAILETLREISERRTTLAIAHRLSTISDADLILVLDAGTIAEAGDHEALLARDGVYAHLWAMQQHAADDERSVAAIPQAGFAAGEV
jgi:ATP-binding cassette subfamily B protein